MHVLAAFLVVCVVVAARAVLAILRLRLLRRRLAAFAGSDAAHVAEQWKRILAQEPRAVAGLVGISLVYVLVTFGLAFHPAVHPDVRSFLLGAVVFWAAGGLCVEAHYLYNRLLMLGNPEGAKRTRVRLPRSGLVTEALIAGYAFLPVLAAWLALRNLFLAGGALAAGIFLVHRVVRIFTVGRLLGRAMRKPTA